MDEQEYRELTAAKRAHAAAFDAGKRRLRQEMADTILRKPDFAITYALEALANKNARWQQWSRDAWNVLLLTKKPEIIAALLVNPSDGNEEALADSHPFGGLADAVRNHH